MPKTLHQPPPTSAVARLLNRDVANRAIVPIQQDSFSGILPVASTISHTTVQAGDGSVPRIKREFILSDHEEATFCELLSLLRHTTRTRLTASQLSRSILKAIQPVLPVLQYESSKLGMLRMPGNGREARGQREEFEQRIAGAIAAAFRAAATIQAAAHESAPSRDRPGR